jgi:hypothetical protein
LREKNRKKKKKKNGEIYTTTATPVAFFFVCAEHVNVRSLDRRKKGTAKNGNNIKKKSRI